MFSRSEIFTVYPPVVSISCSVGLALASLVLLWFRSYGLQIWGFHFSSTCSFDPVYFGFRISTAHNPVVSIPCSLGLGLDARPSVVSIHCWSFYDFKSMFYRSETFNARLPLVSIPCLPDHQRRALTPAVTAGRYI